MDTENDIKLIQNYQHGDQKSLEILIQRYLRLVYVFIYRFVNDASVAEDLTQDVFVRVWKNLNKFDQARNFKTWLFSIAKNATLDYIKKKKAVPLSAFENEAGDNWLADSLKDNSPLPDEIFNQADLAQRLNIAMDNLVPQYKAVLLLRYNDHFNFREIAESLGQSVNTVKSRHRRALAILKKMISK